MSTVAVIIPTYKPQGYIKDCFDSLANQTCGTSNFEVLVVLNGEKDPYFTFLEETLKDYTFTYKLFYDKMPSVSNARNVALDYAEKTQTEYIAFLDDDDAFSPTFIADCLERIKPGTIVVSNTKTFVSDVEKSTGEDYLTHEFRKNQKRKYNIVAYRSFLSTVWSKLIPMGIIGETRFDTGFAIGEDSLFGVEISTRIQKMVLTNNNTVYYRRLRVDSASRKKQKKSKVIKNNLRICLKYTQVYLKNPFKINFIFYLTRIAAAFRNMLIN